MKYIVMRTNLRTLRTDYHIGDGLFMTDIAFAKKYPTREECPHSEKSVVIAKSFGGEVLEKYLYSVVEK